MRYPHPLAGILALSTYLPLRATLAAEAAAANQAIPILMCHGREDPIVPFELGRQSFDALTAPASRRAWLDYPMQHTLCAEEVVHISRWLRQVLPPL